MRTTCNGHDRATTTEYPTEGGRPPLMMVPSAEFSWTVLMVADPCWTTQTRLTLFDLGSLMIKRHWPALATLKTTKERQTDLSVSLDQRQIVSPSRPLDSKWTGIPRCRHSICPCKPATSGCSRRLFHQHSGQPHQDLNSGTRPQVSKDVAGLSTDALDVVSRAVLLCPKRRRGFPVVLVATVHLLPVCCFISLGSTFCLFRLMFPCTLSFIAVKVAGKSRRLFLWSRSVEQHGVLNAIWVSQNPLEVYASGFMDDAFTVFIVVQLRVELSYRCSRPPMNRSNAHLTNDAGQNVISARPWTMLVDRPLSYP
ncbi:hypothetical protein BC567DRAFT_10317 [Phyllosticta citribraziliensis]